MPHIPDSLLRALNAWQNGWSEDQSRKAGIETDLRRETQHLPSEFRAVTGKCYRKRFIHRGEMVALLLDDARDEGSASWTTDQRFAERFKGLYRESAVSAALFCHEPTSQEVIVNIGELWKSNDFIAAADGLRAREPEATTALFHFRDRQAEVVLDAPLRGSEIIALTGVSSPFDELCDHAGIPEQDREEVFRRLVAQGLCPEEPRFTFNAQEVIARTIRRFLAKVEEHKKTQRLPSA